MTIRSALALEHVTTVEAAACRAEVQAGIVAETLDATLERAAALIDDFLGADR